ncbi:MAG: hypothetical protein J6X55_10410 [Victivallales bacterium]|nr:hypothetical protein [Victivallales bacterium]
MDSMDVIAILLALAGFVCVVFAVGFVIFLIFEDFFRKVFKMKKKDDFFNRSSTFLTTDEPDKKK